MAGIENPGGGEDFDVAMPEEDEMSGCCFIGGFVCMGCVIVGASGALATLCTHATATSAVAQALAGAGIVVGFLGKALGYSCCLVAGDEYFYGNTEGIRQQDPPRAHAAVD